MPSNPAFVEGLIDGFNHVVTGFALAVKTACEGACHLVEDAYHVNVTLWDGHVETLAFLGCS